MAAEQNNGGYAVEAALFDLHRATREAPTLPILPDFIDADDVAADIEALKAALREQRRAIADGFMLYNDRQQKIATVLSAMNLLQKERHQEILAAIGAIAAQR